MKKILIITGIVVVLLVTALAVIPLFFKSTLLEKTKTVLNQHINAEVEFADLRLSLLRNFPKVTVGLTDLVVTGKGEFREDTLFTAPALHAKTGLGQLFHPGNMNIGEIVLKRPQLKLVVGETGDVNWDLVLETKPEVPADTMESALELELDKIDISDALFVYDDRELDMLLRFEGINIGISGNMYGTAAELLAEGNAANFLLAYKGTSYISHTTLETKTRLGIDYEKMDIAIRENELFVNRLPMEVTGMIQMPGDSMYFDLQVATKNSGFENFLALIPPDYESYLEDMETAGTASIDGSVKGIYYEDAYPALNLNLEVREGIVRYAGLPGEIKKISAGISVNKPQGVLDLMRIAIKNAHAEVKNNPVDLSLTLEKPFSDPFFNGSLTGKLNFDELKDVLPLDSVNLSGTVDADLAVNGNYSAIEKEQYNKIKSDGRISLNGIVYDSPDLTQAIIIPGGEMLFSPEAVTLSGFGVRIGKSDFNLQGNILNYLPYFINDGVLTGNLQLNSSLVNLNELLRLQVEEETAASAAGSDSRDNQPEEEEATLAFNVPQNVDITFRSAIDRVVFGRLPLTDVQGTITARKGKLSLDGLNMHTLDGGISLTGSYENTPEDQPLFDFGVDILQVDLPTAYKTLAGIQKMVPVAGQSQGKFSSSLEVRGNLSPQLGLMAPTVDGSGSISTKNLEIKHSSLFNQLKGILKAEMLNDVKVDDFNAMVEITDGTIALKPFSTRVAGQETTIYGEINTENLLDMRLDFNVQRDAFGPDIENILSILPGEERIGQLPASVLLKGPVKQPEVKINLDDARKKIAEEVKKSTRDDLQKSIEKMGEGLKKIFK